MPRTTLNIDGSVLGELKRLQRQEGKSLGQLVSELLARVLADDPTAEPGEALEWISQPMRS